MKVRHRNVCGYHRLLTEQFPDLLLANEQVQVTFDTTQRPQGCQQ